MRRGDICWYKFARPDKRRPVLVLTRDSALEFLGEVTIAPLTTTIRDIPTEVPLSRQDGAPRECAVNLDHVQTVSRGRLGPLIVQLKPEKLAAVEKALLFVLGFRIG